MLHIFWLYVMWFSRKRACTSPAHKVRSSAVFLFGCHIEVVSVVFPVFYWQDFNDDEMQCESLWIWQWCFQSTGGAPLIKLLILSVTVVIYYRQCLIDALVHVLNTCSGRAVLVLAPHCWCSPFSFICLRWFILISIQFLVWFTSETTVKMHLCFWIIAPSRHRCAFG